MTDLAVRHSGAALPVLTRPNLSPWLSTALRDAMSPHPDLGPQPVRSGVREQARLAVATFEALLRPATIEEWAFWLAPFRAVLANPPPSREDLVRSATAIASALPEVPAAALTADAQREVMRSLRFWPTPADLWLLLHPRFAERQAELVALRRLAVAPVEREPEPMPPDVRKAFAVRLRALAGELQARAEAPGRQERPVRPMPLSDGALLARYERLAAEGNAAAATRAEMLRARMAEQVQA